MSSLVLDHRCGWIPARNILCYIPDRLKGILVISQKQKVEIRRSKSVKNFVTLIEKLRSPMSLNKPPISTDTKIKYKLHHNLDWR